MIIKGNNESFILVFSFHSLMIFVMIKTPVKFILLICFFCLGFLTKAQSVDIDLIESNILDRIEYRQELTTGTLTKKNSWRNTTIKNFVMLKSSSGIFTHDA